MSTGHHAFAKAPSAYAEWRGEFLRRLAVLLPSTSYRTESQSGVSARAVADILETSKAFASQALTRPDYQLNYGHIVRIADHLKVDRKHLLVADYFDRFAQVEDLELAVRDERRVIQSMLTRIYLETRTPAPASTPASSVLRTFEARRRAEIKSRLAKIMPGQNGAAVSASALSEALGRSKSAASMIVNGPSYLTYAQAILIKERYGFEPEWVLAADLLDEFKSGVEFERAIDGEAAPVQKLLRQLWSARCSSNLTGS